LETGLRFEAVSIRDHGIIGDCRSAALVSTQGAIDWLCWPRFDSPAVFAALLDPEGGGYWRISPRQYHRVERTYLGESNILQTRFFSPSGTTVLTDLMPLATMYSTLVPAHEILRIVECPAGEVDLEVTFLPRAKYGLGSLRINDLGALGLQMDCGRGSYWLRSSARLENLGERAIARVPMHAGETLKFSLSYAEEAPAVLLPLDQTVSERIASSARWWQQWARQADYDGPHRHAVVRSALTLKLLTYSLSGAIVAAPTSSLPERIGSSLNWDYRYCWLRDASLTVRALLELGYWAEAENFLDWMLHATRLTQPELRILYDIFGESAPRERSLDHLSGYRGSRPVRIGNAARSQLQLDVYGEVIDAAAQYVFHGGRLDREMQKALIGFGNEVVKRWREPDEGIWEPRSARAHHTHSRLLCWTALDRLISLYRKGLLPGAPLDRYHEHSELIGREIQQFGWNSDLGSYVSVLNSDQLDASILLLSWYGFEEAASERMQSTHTTIRKALGTSNGLLYRYRVIPEEGTFALCSFWEAEFLALGGGSLEEAKALFENLLRYSNDLGLFGEEIDPNTGDALGNFPQAFTHVGLIGAALSISQREKGEQQLGHRPERAAARPTSEKDDIRT
jgi:GH15 family glucan-1,4-alpha-glucosidase